MLKPSLGQLRAERQTGDAELSERIGAVRGEALAAVGAVEERSNRSVAGAVEQQNRALQTAVENQSKSLQNLAEKLGRAVQATDERLTGGVRETEERLSKAVQAVDERQKKALQAVDEKHAQALVRVDQAVEAMRRFQTNLAEELRAAVEASKAAAVAESKRLIAEANVVARDELRGVLEAGLASQKAWSEEAAK